jgi:hypothetical protein
MLNMVLANSVSVFFVGMVLLRIFIKVAVCSFEGARVSFIKIEIFRDGIEH